MAKRDDELDRRHLPTLEQDGTPCRGWPTDEEREEWRREEQRDRDRDALATAGFGIDAEPEDV